MIVALLSGGVDSTAMVIQNLDRIDRCLFVDYGQPANRKEEEFSRDTAESLGIDFHLVRFEGLSLGEMINGSSNSPRVVPARNAILISIAANIASDSKSMGTVLIGAQAGDVEDYPDTRSMFISRMNGAMVCAYNVLVEAPMLRMTRSQTQKIVDINLIPTWSCYTPREDGNPCEECNSCRQ